MAMEQLDQLFPSFPLLTSKKKGQKIQKLQTVLTSLAWPLKAERARKLLEEIMRHKSTINVALQGQLLAEFRNIKQQLDDVYTTFDASEKRKLYMWLQDTNPSSSHNAAKALYEKKTGDWVFNTPDWGEWINSRLRALWIHGIPGAGKTILAAHIVEKIVRICERMDKYTKCVYYYCYHGHNQDESLPFLRWLSSQLLRETDEVTTVAWKAYKRNLEPDSEALLEILSTTLDCFDQVYVVVDALDESQSRHNLLQILNVLVTDPRFSKIQLLATSRDYADIELQMCRFSQSLSMSNSFVGADIRIYVAAKIMTEAKFQRWPLNLRVEVEETLSIGARGMFRWVVCQLDILRRLNNQSKIREALTSLPRTMDETYERTFSYIGEEEKEFVRHALHWVCFHDFLWKGKIPLPANVLIDAYIAFDDSSHRGLARSEEHLYDLDSLKDSCGCLVSFNIDQTAEAHLASVAHYTVREFLESDRSSRTSWFNIKQPASYSSILGFVMDYTITSEPIQNPENWDHGSPLDLRSTSTLQEYCAAASVRALRDHEELIEPRLAFRFLDPLESHFTALQKALIILTANDKRDILSSSYEMVGFWDVYWQDSAKESKTIVLAHLILMGCFVLAKKFIQHLDVKAILEESLGGSISTMLIWMGDHGALEREFQCNLVEFLAEIRTFDKPELEFFERELAGIVSYTNLLPFYMPSHEFEEPACEDTCILPRLLQNGANPDPSGFQVTPLQIAVHARDLAGVNALLEAGADPNNTGDAQGVYWDPKTSVLGPYTKLRGLAPLYILRHLKAYPWCESGMLGEDIDLMNGETTTAIERLLLNYGAFNISVENK